MLSHLPEDQHTDDPAFVLTEHGRGQCYDLSYSNGARFVIDETGERMWGSIQPPLVDEDLSLYFLGPVMGFLLRHRHMTCLHASAVQLHERAILFSGDPGYGKSTTAAALALRNVPVLCEEIVPLELTGGRYYAIPGYPRVCLWPDAVAKLVGDADALPRLSPGWEKRYLALDGVRARFANEKKPLGIIYLFAIRTADPGAPRIEQVRPKDALLGLVQNTYMNWLLDRPRRAEEFEELWKIVQEVPVRRIVAHSDGAKLVTETSSASLTFAKEWAFLCQCASPQCNSSEIAALMQTGFNWETLLDLADSHSVQGVVAKRLEELAFASVPALVREQLQIRMRAQHLFSLSMTAELFRILQQFSCNLIDAVLVKGPLISVLAYGDPAVRSYVDLDLLLRHRDISSAVRCMLALGFHSDVPEVAIRAGKIPGEYLFRRPGTQRVIELHTQDTFRYYPKPMPLEDLFARRRFVPVDGREMPALSLEDELVLNCIHGAKHFWESLMWVSDIAAVVARHPEISWDVAERSAAEVGADRMLRVGVLLGSMLLQVPLPRAIAQRFQRDRGAQSLCRRIQTWLPFAGAAPPALPKRAMFRLQMAGGGVTGLAYLGRLSLSPTQEDWEKGAEERSSWLRDAARRPFRLFRKYGSD
ncbi:MAG TPA: nucleotidyltransferase family protein [Verrucomicrobiae bacterium]|nr:nucleotidyltransferase family protein [Verrucomicrobiae bacterium]